MKGMDLIDGVLQSFLPFLYLVGAVFVFAAVFKAVRREIGSSVTLFVGGLLISGMPVLLGVVKGSLETPDPVAEPASTPTPESTPTGSPAPWEPASRPASVDFAWLPGALMVLVVVLGVVLLVWCVCTTWHRPGRVGVQRRGWPGS